MADYGPKSYIDRTKSHRTVPMRCLVLGLGRTGTKCKPPSLLGKSIDSSFARLTGDGTRKAVSQALRILGFNETYHMESALWNPMDNHQWIDAIAGKFRGGKPYGRAEWDQLLGHCQVHIGPKSLRVHANLSSGRHRFSPCPLF